MKTKATLLLVLIFGFNFGFSQTDCATKLSLMVEAAKAKSYDTAYPYLMELRKDCPTFNRATYVYGERILNFKIDGAEGEEKKAFINDLVKLYDERLTSQIAQKSLIMQGVKTGHNKDDVDKTAAAVFLQNYLDENKK